MPISGIEAFAAGIMRFEGYDPMTRSFNNNNPGNLRSAIHVDAGVPTSYPVDDKGYVIFPDFCTGWNCLLRDLRAKFTGQNSHGLGPSSTLLSLMKIYAPSEDSNQPEEYAQFLARWLSSALKKPITIESELVNIWQSGQPPVPVVKA
jgi:hypothetical protein